MIPHTYIICKKCKKKEYMTWHPIWKNKELCYDCRERMYSKHKTWMDKLLLTDKSKLFKYSPDYAIPPGETISELLEHLGMTQIELANRTGRSEKTISDIINGKQGIIPETALQFERVLGISASFLNNLEKNYREWTGRK